MQSPNAILKCIRDILRFAVYKLSWICIAELFGRGSAVFTYNILQLYKQNGNFV